MLHHCSTSSESHSSYKHTDVCEYFSKLRKLQVYKGEIQSLEQVKIAAAKYVSNN